MSGEKIFQALGSISDEKLESAMYVYERKESRKRIWIRAAMCAAMVALLLSVIFWPRHRDHETHLDVPTKGQSQVATVPSTEVPQKAFITVPSVVKLYSYVRVNTTGEPMEKYEVTDAIDKQSAFWIEGGYEYDIRFTFSLPMEYYTDAKVTFAVYAPYGDFRVLDDDQKSVSVGKMAQVPTNEILRWRPKEDVQKMKEEMNPGDMYFRVLIYADDQLVGFGLVELGCNYLFPDYTVSFYAITLRRFRTVCYPMVDGQYQPVTEAYVWDEIAKYEQAMRKEMEQLRVNQSTEEEGA